MISSGEFAESAMSIWGVLEPEGLLEPEGALRGKMYRNHNVLQCKRNPALRLHFEEQVSRSNAICNNSAERKPPAENT